MKEEMNRQSDVLTHEPAAPLGTPSSGNARSSPSGNGLQRDAQIWSKPPTLHLSCMPPMARVIPVIALVDAGHAPTKKGGHFWPPLQHHALLSRIRAAVLTYVLKTAAAKADVRAYVYCLRESARFHVLLQR